jgi:1-acyl-sn-glycerol-3-phosphate acyltransferase
MKRKIFNTPIITPLITALFAFIMKALGWTVVGKPPLHLKKFVAVVAPHTSNWDAVIVLMTSFALKLDAHWMAKHTLFRFPFGGVMRWLGAVPVHRTKNGNITDAIVKQFTESESMVIGISPEATRSEVTRWRTGFWYIAKEANVRIVLFFIDGEHKRCGFLEVFESSGDCLTDVELIKKKFEHFKGINHRT